jgi:hypothetical protein
VRSLAAADDEDNRVRVAESWLRVSGQEYRMPPNDLPAGKQYHVNIVLNCCDRADRAVVSVERACVAGDYSS